jgi:hypothetical protein
MEIIVTLNRFSRNEEHSGMHDHRFRQIFARSQEEIAGNWKKIWKGGIRHTVSSEI